MAFVPFAAIGGEAAGAEVFGTVGEGAVWGGSEGISAEAGPSANPMDVGNGNTMTMNPDGLQEYLNSDNVKAALLEKAQAVADAANAIAQIKGAEYGVVMQDSPAYSQPQALVKAINVKGWIDDAAHSTLLIAAAHVGTDQYASAEDSPAQEMSPGLSDDYSLGEGEGVIESGGGEVSGLLAGGQPTTDLP